MYKDRTIQLQPLPPLINMANTVLIPLIPIPITIDMSPLNNMMLLPFLTIENMNQLPPPLLLLNNNINLTLISLLLTIPILILLILIPLILIISNVIVLNFYINIIIKLL